METIPTCMQQYKDIYGTVRVPGVECDVLQCYKSSHVSGERASGSGRGRVSGGVGEGGRVSGGVGEG